MVSLLSWPVRGEDSAPVCAESVRWGNSGFPSEECGEIWLGHDPTLPFLLLHHLQLRHVKDFHQWVDFLNGVLSTVSCFHFFFFFFFSIQEYMFYFFLLIGFWAEAQCLFSHKTNFANFSKSVQNGEEKDCWISELGMEVSLKLWARILTRFMPPKCHFQWGGSSKGRTTGVFFYLLYLIFSDGLPILIIGTLFVRLKTAFPPKSLMVRTFSFSLKTIRDTNANKW